MDSPVLSGIERNRNYWNKRVFLLPWGTAVGPLGGSEDVDTNGVIVELRQRLLPGWFHL